MIKHTAATFIAATFLAATVAACATAPETRSEQRSLEEQADAALDAMLADDPTLQALLADSAGYAVFPDVGEGAFFAGAAHGNGVVYQHGTPIGYATLTEASGGPQVGGQGYAQLVVLRTDDALQRLKSDNLDFDANATATFISRGVAAEADFEDGTAAFIDGEQGLMAGVSIGGQNIEYQPG